MNNDPFTQWQRLSHMLDRVDETGLKALTHEELLEFGQLYRRSVSALSHARAHGLDPERTRYLNHLVGRAYGHVYVAAPEDEDRSILTFFLQKFPGAVRAHWRYLAAATGFIALVGVVSYLLLMVNPELAWEILPQEFEFMSTLVVERHEQGGDWLPLVTRPESAAQIITNNIGVSFFAFAGGVLLGLGTLYILYYNGVMLGAIVAAFVEAPAAAALNFWGFVAPHGVLELPAIFLAASAGLMLGYALVNPGDHDRKTALKLAGRQAANIVLGVAALLVIAGIIEGFFSPTLTSELNKFLFAGALFLAFIWYLFLMPLRQPRRALTLLNVTRRD